MQVSGITYMLVYCLHGRRASRNWKRRPRADALLPTTYFQPV